MGLDTVFGQVLIGGRALHTGAGLGRTGQQHHQVVLLKRDLSCVACSPTLAVDGSRTRWPLRMAEATATTAHMVAT